MDSLFALVETSVARGSLFGEPISPESMLVCDDDAHETADFYLIDPTAQRIVLIHLKAKNEANPGVGASGLHEVVAQAQKHLRTIQPGAAFFNRGQVSRRWARNWNASKPGGGIARLRTAHSAAEVAAAAWDALRDPNYNREVLIAAAGILSKRKFVTAARTNKPQALQALYLMQSAWSTAGAIGARLSIVVNP